MPPKRLEQKPRRAKGFIAAVLYCTVIVTAFFSPPYLLRWASAETYVQSALRAVAGLSDTTRRMASALALPAWERLAGEATYLTITMDLEAPEGGALRQPFPQGLRWQGEMWRSAEPCALSSRNILFWDENVFRLDTHLDGAELIAYAPQLFQNPLSLTPDSIRSVWNESFLAEILHMPSWLSLSVPLATAPAVTVSDALHAHLRDLAAFDIRSAEVDPDTPGLSLVAYALPQAECRALYQTLAGAFRDRVAPLRFLPDMEQTWEALMPSDDVFADGEATLWIDGMYCATRYRLTLPAGGGDALVLTADWEGEKEGELSLSFEIRRIRQGEPDALAGFSLAGLSHLANTEEIQGECALWYDPGLAPHGLSVSYRLGLAQAEGNLSAEIEWDGASATLTGGYAADAEAARVSLSIDSFTSGTFALAGRLTLDWRLAGADTPAPPALPEGARPIGALTHLEQKAILASFYQLFYGAMRSP
ncbi:MAG: hypothetical protein FWE59_06680 [Oscillospiraceae bacterium]|nr:hypothetical protein [Oscillospiraceae bacterium]